MYDETYLNFKNIPLSANYLEGIGVFKLFLIRQISIHYRHLLKAQHKIDKIKSTKIKEIFQLYNQRKDWLLDRYNRRLEKLHKLPRTKKDIRFKVIFDFDHTLTTIVRICKNKQYDIPTYIFHQVSSSIRRILKKDFFDLFYNKSFINYLDFMIISATGDKEHLVTYLKKHNLISIFPKIIATGGVKEKIEEIYNTTKKSISCFWFIVDDDIDLLNLYKLFLILPIKCNNKAWLKPHIETYN